MGTFYWTHTLLQQLQYNACIGLPLKKIKEKLSMKDESEGF